MSRNAGFPSGYHVYWLEVEYGCITLPTIYHISVIGMVTEKENQMSKAGRLFPWELFASSRDGSGNDFLWPHFPEPWLLARKGACLWLLPSHRHHDHRDQVLPAFFLNLSVVLTDIGKWIEWRLLCNMPKSSWLVSVTPFPCPILGNLSVKTVSVWCLWSKCVLIKSESSQISKMR